MWLISSLDFFADRVVRAIHGHDCARAVSYWLDRLANRTTACYDACTIGGPDRYRPVNGANIHEARKFRRKYVLPRRRLVRRRNGELRWERLTPGEDTLNSRTYQECDIPLSSLSEFGEGWVLYFWTLKMVGFVCVVAMFVAIGSWHDMLHRRGRTALEPHSKQSSPVDSSIVNQMLGKLGSAECVRFAVVCFDDQCGETRHRHICPAPHPVNAVVNILVVGIFALFVMALRRTHLGTSHYVKSVEGATGLRTEDYSVLVENPPADAEDPDEWHKFFCQFGDVAYVTVAKADGNLVWKCLEPRQLMAQLYRDNPALLTDRFAVVDENAAAGLSPLKDDDEPHRGADAMKRLRHRKSTNPSFSLVERDDVLLRGKAADVEDGDLDVGDEDAEGGPEDSLPAMAPWYHGGKLELTPDLMTLAAKIDEAEAEAAAAASSVEAKKERWWFGAGDYAPLRIMTIKNPVVRYTHPYIVWRWLRMELVNGFPHYLGTMRQADRDMIAQRLFDECPKELSNELKWLAEGNKYRTVKVFVTFETIRGRRECLTGLGNSKHLPAELKFRGQHALFATIPPAPEQVIWWNLGVGQWQRFKDDVFSLFITSMLVMVAYCFALFVSVQDEKEHKNSPQVLRAFGFAVWGQLYQTMCTQTFGWIATQEHHHDEDAKQLSLLLRYSFLKCITSVIFILTIPKTETLSVRSVTTMKTFLYADAVVGPFMRYVDIFQQIKRFLARFLPNQAVMNWAHLSPAHDIADSYSNVVKTIFLGLFVLAVVPSAPILTAASCLTSYWVDKHAICRMWSWNARAKPAKWTAETVQNLLGLVLIGAMMKTQQLYKNWPFDNLCRAVDEASGEPLVAPEAAWRRTRALNGDVWVHCVPEPTSLLGRRGHTSLNLWLTPQPWMSEDHQRAIHIYSVGSVVITVTLLLYFWGRTALDLAKHVFCMNKTLTLEKPGEERLPTFSDHGGRRAAYIPTVMDGSFMFPLLQTDVTLMDEVHIPWLADYGRTNLASDIGLDATAQGLHHRFSVIKRYGSPGAGKRASDMRGYVPSVSVLAAEAMDTPRDTPPIERKKTRADSADYMVHHGTDF